MNAPGVLAVLELIAQRGDGRPDLLESVAAYLRPAPGAVALAERWGVEVGELAATVRLAVERLDQIERRRLPGQMDAEDVGGRALVLPMIDVIRARVDRVSAIRRRQRLAGLARRLEPLARETRIRARLDAFLAEPGGPVDLERWFRA